MDGGTFLLVDESYNASPASVAAALETLGRARPAMGGRRIAVLGDMLELGADSAQRHADLIEPVREAGIDLVFTAGRDMLRLWEALPRARCGGSAPDSKTLAPLVAAAVRPGDIVMVKGSAGSRMGVVVQALEALAPRTAGKQEGR
jgi:UDP-N-acetylmuramoyl-tripeptide--D-alanyl-D-alanine ligase